MDKGSEICPPCVGTLIGEPGALVNVASTLAGATGKDRGFDAVVTPGLTTVTEAVPALATSEVGTAAVKREAETKVVGSGVPFHFTAAPETKPVPFTVKVNAGPPGAAEDGTGGWFKNGTGF
jgi:hypothetical protein